MAATYVTKAELRTNLGIGTLYTDAVVEEVCQSAQDLLNQYLWFNDAPVVAAGLQDNVATLVLANPGIFVKGQTIAVEGCGSIYGGQHVITGTIPGSNIPVSIQNTFYNFFYNYSWPNGYSFIQFAKVHANDPFHRILPYGKAVGPDKKEDDYAVIPAIREAAMILAVDIWQARQVSQTGGVGMDGVSASPYRMGYQLINRVRGLIQPYSAPASLVG
jgi:hypothetical protein